MIKAKENGLTLIELLAVIAVSSIVLFVAYSILTSMLRTSDRTTVQTQLRNEAITISQRMDNILVNIDSVDNGGVNGIFQNFNAIDNRKTETSPGVFSNSPITTPIAITNGNLLINNQIVNSANFSLQNTTFKLLDNDTSLQINYEILDIKTNQTFKMFKIYSLQGG
jgi:prepilin-type N-terminal cleavage/methylation domain-containing protein